MCAFRLLLLRPPGGALNIIHPDCQSSRPAHVVGLFWGLLQYFVYPKGQPMHITQARPHTVPSLNRFKTHPNDFIVEPLKNPTQGLLKALTQQINQSAILVENLVPVMRTSTACGDVPRLVEG